MVVVVRRFGRHALQADTDELCHLEYAKGYAEGSAQSGWSGEADAEPEQGCIRIDKDGKSVWQCD